jgi:hypothetical protein
LLIIQLHHDEIEPRELVVEEEDGVEEGEVLQSQQISIKRMSYRMQLTIWQA